MTGWSQARLYGSGSPQGQADAADRVGSLAPLAGPGDSALLAVELATGRDVDWSQTSYHGPRRHRPRAIVDGPRSAELSPRIDNADSSAKAAPSVMASSASMALASMVSRITGFVRTFALAAVLPAGVSYAVGDAYNLANTLPNMVYELMLGGVLTSVVIPILVKAQHDDADGGVGYTQRLLSLAVAGLGIGTAAAVIAAPLLIDFFGGPSHYQAVATLWAMLLLPEIFFYGVGALLGAVLNTRDVYGWPAWAPVLNNLITTAAVGVFVLVPGPAALTTGSITHTQIWVMGIGTTLGIAAQALVLILPLRRLGWRWNWRFRAKPNEAGRISEFRALSLWVLGYVAISQVGVVMINKVANPRGGVTIFTYADLLFQVPYGILGVSLLTALMPRMSRAAAVGDTPAVLEDLRLGARLSAVVLLPVTAGFVVFGPALTSIILLGSYGEAAAQLTGEALASSAFGLLPFALVMLQQRVFYAVRDTRTPTLINLGMVATKVVMVLVASQLLPTRWVIISLTVSTSASYLVGCLLGHVLLQRRFGTLQFRSVWPSVGWIGLASAGSGLAGFAVRWLVSAVLGTGRGTDVVQLLLGGTVGLAVLIAIATKLPLPEVAQITETIRARTGRSRTAT